MQGETPAGRAFRGPAPVERRRAPERPRCGGHRGPSPSALPRPASLPPPPFSPPLQPPHLLLHHLPSPIPSCLCFLIIPPDLSAYISDPCPKLHPHRCHLPVPATSPPSSLHPSQHLSRPLRIPIGALPVPVHLSSLLLKAHPSSSLRSLTSHPFTHSAPSSFPQRLSPHGGSLQLALLPRTLTLPPCICSPGYLHPPLSHSHP